MLPSIQRDRGARVPGRIRGGEFAGGELNLGGAIHLEAPSRAAVALVNDAPTVAGAGGDGFDPRCDRHPGRVQIDKIAGRARGDVTVATEGERRIDPSRRPRRRVCERTGTAGARGVDC